MTDDVPVLSESSTDKGWYLIFSLMSPRTVGNSPFENIDNADSVDIRYFFVDHDDVVE